jgi:hypothetical protein
MVAHTASLGPDAVRMIAGLLRIAHHIPGRVRFKLEGQAGMGMAEAIETAKSFVACVSGMAGIRSVALNPLARSCLVEYDPAIISSSTWEDLIGGTRSAAADTLVNTLVAASG